MPEQVRHSLQDPYICRNREDLVRCLEEYCILNGRAKVQRLGAGGGEEATADRYDMILRQNGAIDRAMLRLRVLHFLSWQLVDAYYREGWHEEADGWKRTMSRAGLHWQIQTYREETLLEHVFRVVLGRAIDSLLACHKGMLRADS